MKFFVDTAEIKEILELAETGLLDGGDNQPIADRQIGQGFHRSHIRDLRRDTGAGFLPKYPPQIPMEMIAEGTKLAALADNVVVKLPLTMDGLRGV